MTRAARVADVLLTRLELLRRRLTPAPLDVMQRITGAWITQSLYVAAKLSVADVLAGGPKSVDEIAKAVGAAPGPLYRVLRALASTGIFVEQEGRRFALTPSASTLRKDVPGSLRDTILYFGDGWIWRPWGELYEGVREGTSAFRHVHGAGLYEFLPKNQEANEVFNNAMASASELAAKAVAACYDFSGAQKVVDVGGGQGMLLAEILEVNPELKGQVYDLPSVVDSARSFIERRGLSSRIEVAAGDFFTQVPTGGDTYMLKNILHSWDDERARTILRACRAAVPAHGRLLIVDMIIPEGNLPFLGKMVDLHMLMLHAEGRDRTAEEYGALLAAEGFRMTRQVRTYLPVSVLEARPV
ncbi:acetylserotonin O-methyltransferase [Hyalangium versicolor]|uniref:acetylserotonin O-methyltransferase n=1 Tax=Hyalangium versicolor TaxID=2861190 RepID=UPI001CCE10FE|nr:acetylserotonin O-methyltransferase [Hyalangium versicolor]